MGGKKKKLLVLDVDGVILDLSWTLAQEFSDELEARIVPGDFGHWDFEDALGVTTETANRVLLRAVKISSPVFHDARAFLDIMRGEVKIKFLTSRIPEGREQLLRDLKTVKVKEKDVIFETDKNKVLLELKPDIFVDDKMKYVVNSPVASLLLDRPYNKARDLYVSRIYSLFEVFEWL